MHSFWFSLVREMRKAAKLACTAGVRDYAINGGQKIRADVDDSGFVQKWPELSSSVAHFENAPGRLTGRTSLYLGPSERHRDLFCSMTTPALPSEYRAGSTSDAKQLFAE